MPKFKDKDRIWKASKEKQFVAYKGAPMQTVSWFLNRNFTGQKGVAKNIQSDEK